MTPVDFQTHYSAVFKSLEDRRVVLRATIGDLKRQLKQLDAVIKNISSLPEVGPSITPVPGKYTYYSTRWSILSLLNESVLPLSTQDIADDLLKGGIRTAAANFSHNVSALITQMKVKSEVKKVGKKWMITEVGRTAWNSRSKHYIPLNGVGPYPACGRFDVADRLPPLWTRTLSEVTCPQCRAALKL